MSGYRAAGQPTIISFICLVIKTEVAQDVYLSFWTVDNRQYTVDNRQQSYQNKSCSECFYDEQLTYKAGQLKSPLLLKLHIHVWAQQSGKAWHTDPFLLGVNPERGLCFYTVRC